MSAVTRRAMITVCLAAILAASAVFAGRSQSGDEIGDVRVYIEDVIKLLSSGDEASGTRTWETAWIFAGLVEPEPTGPDEEPIPEDPIP